MKKLAVVGCVLLVFGLNSCFLSFLDEGELCPRSVELGKLQFINSNFSPYKTSNQVLDFRATSGETRTLSNSQFGSKFTTSRLEVETTCFHNALNKQVYYYQIPDQFISFLPSKEENQNGITYSYTIQDFRVDRSKRDTIAADVLSITNQFTVPWTELRILVNDRNNLNRFDKERYPYKDSNNFRVIADTTVNQQPYKNVYVSTLTPTLLFTQKEGIIAFLKGTDEWFYLQ